MFALATSGQLVIKMATFLPQHLVTLSAESWLCTTQGQNKTFTKFIVSRLACSAKADAVSIYLDVYGFIWIGNKRILFSTVATHWTCKQGFNRQMIEECTSKLFILTNVRSNKTHCHVTYSLLRSRIQLPEKRNYFLVSKTYFQHK